LENGFVQKGRKMKTIRILFLFLALFFSPTYSVFADAGISLVEARNDSGGGILLVFKINGDIPKAQLHNGNVVVQGGDSYGLHCNLVDDSTVQCSTSQKASGKNVVVFFANKKFWVFVPDKPAEIVSCYPVYDWDDSFNPTSWVYYGQHCQKQVALDGDQINWVNPALLPPYVYSYSSSNQPYWCSWTGLGPGYYYPFCLD
jgi:hypothetical protein